MKKKSLLAIAIGLLLFNFGCRSTPEVNEDGEVKAVAADSPAKAGKSQTAKPDHCAARPELQACCEALIPSCNQCRADNEAKMEAWEKECLTTGGPGKDCSQGAPISDCCTENTEECDACRAKAAETMLAWKKQCGTLESVSCDKAPEEAMCCQAMIPSCELCKSRNARVRADWERRCRKKD